MTVGFNDQDFALALGVKPVGVRQFQGGIDITERPWAQDELAGAEPQIIGAEDLEFEKIAALRPDLILAVYSGLNKRDYGTLSKIAPIVAQTDEYPDYGVPWQEQAEVSSRALGLQERGSEIVDSVEDEFAKAREEQLRLLDQDVLVVYGSEKDFEGFPLFQRLDAVREGRVIYMDVDGDFANAIGFSSPLSIPFALGEAVPQLSTAVEAK